jgi:UDP-GlcNAc:undecaprenyl-phosphate/decaprenyl-phosphate GlcNAc-1-phosphate transferase
LNPILALMLAAATSAALIPFVQRLAPRLGLLDIPDPRKVHARPVPRVGGWGIFAGALIALPLLLGLESPVGALLAGMIVLFLFGVWDDARQIGHWPKFVGQIIAVALVVYWGDLYVSRVPFMDMALPGWLGRPLTMVAMIGVINAINHSDGLDGLAAGESMLSLVAIAVLSWSMGANSVVLGVSLVTMGALLGFLRYNSHPAQVFMGDAGSQVLGFSLAFLAVYLTQVSYTALSAALPLLLLGLPIADILAVLYLRASGGRSWFAATRNHIHHRLLDIGFTHYEAVVLIYLVQTLLVSAAVLMRFESDTLVTMVYIAVVGSVFAGLMLAERYGWKRSGGASFARMTDVRILQRWVSALIATALSVLLLVSAAFITSVPRDVSIMAGALSVVLALELLRTRGNSSLPVRAVSYVTLAVSAYLLIRFPVISPVTSVMAPALVIALAGLIGMYIRFASNSSFDTTPTDVLIMLGVMVLTYFSSVHGSSAEVARVAIYAAVLMYAFEVAGYLQQPRLLHFSVLATLAGMTLRGLLG